MVRRFGRLAATAAVCAAALVIGSLAGNGGRSDGGVIGCSGTDAIPLDLGGTNTNGSDFLYIARTGGDDGGPIMSIDDGRGSAGIVPLYPTRSALDPAFSHCSINGVTRARWRSQATCSTAGGLTGRHLMLTERRYGCKADDCGQTLGRERVDKDKRHDAVVILPVLVGSYTTKDDAAYTLRIAVTGRHGGKPSLSLDAGPKLGGIVPTAITVEGNRIVLHEVECGSRAEETIYGTQSFRWN